MPTSPIEYILNNVLDYSGRECRDHAEERPGDQEEDCDEPRMRNA